MTSQHVKHDICPFYIQLCGHLVERTAHCRNVILRQRAYDNLDQVAKRQSNKYTFSKMRALQVLLSEQICIVTAKTYGRQGGQRERETTCQTPLREEMIK
jgi:hypothetical protein